MDVTLEEQLAFDHGDDPSVWSFASSRDGRTVATSDMNARTRIWDARTGTRLADLHFASSPGYCAFDAEGTLAIMSGGLEQIAVWERSTGRVRLISTWTHGLTGRGASSVAALAVSADGTRIAVAEDPYRPSGLARDLYGEEDGPGRIWTQSAASGRSRPRTTSVA